MELVDVVIVEFVSVMRLDDLDRTTDDDVQRATVGHHPDVVVEDTARVEQGDGESHGVFHEHLELVDEGMAVRGDLFVEIVLAE